MKDIYVMNKETGEIIPAQQAISEYYKTHGIFDAWTDEWEETDLEVENSTVEIPNFTMIF